MTTKIAVLILFLCACVSQSIAEDLDPWTPATVCGAAAMVYYYLDDPADVVSVDGDAVRLRSKSGYVYDCVLKDGFAEFRWKNTDGSPREYLDSEYLIEGGRLTISSDGMVRSFERSGDGFRALDG